MAGKVIRDIPDYLRLTSQFWDKHGEAFFRGQSTGWRLLPSIARWTPVVKGYKDWRVFQKDLVERFAKYAAPLLQSAPQSSAEWLVHAQHHGVPTRLLDWTTNPLKALFWAVEDSTQSELDAVVWAFAPRHWNDDPIGATELSDNELTPYYPKLLNARVFAQEACFVAFPLHKNQAPLVPMDGGSAYQKSINELVPITIPKSARPLLRRELRYLGVSHRTIYPDLVGIANAIKSDLRETM
jgi:hypothetical protein